MAHLKGITIKNFRTFTKSTTFKTLPISILTGENGSGKSTVIKALELLSYSGKQYNFHHLDFIGPNHLFSTFDESINKDFQEADEIRFSLMFDDNRLLFGNNIRLFTIPQLISLSYKKHKNQGVLFHFNLRIGDHETPDTLILNFQQPDKDEDKIRFGLNIKYFLSRVERGIKEFKKRNLKNPQYPVKYYDKDKKIKTKLIPIDFSQPAVNNKPIEKKYLNISTDIIDKKKLKEFLKINDEKEFKAIYEIINEHIIYALSYLDFNKNEWESFLHYEQIYGCFYEANLFNVIARYFDPGYDTNNVFTKEIKNIDFNEPIYSFELIGNEIGKTQFILSEKQEENLRRIASLKLGELIKPEVISFIKQFIKDQIYDVLKDLKSSCDIAYIESFRSTQSQYNIGSKQTADWNSMLLKFSQNDLGKIQKQFLNKWIQRFEIGDKIKIKKYSGHYSRVVLKKGNHEYDLAEMGFGYTQLLPIILKVILDFPEVSQEYNRDIYLPNQIETLIIEEPEGNLHPRMQSIMADFFIDIIQTFYVNLIIETHSEYLIRKLQYLVAKKMAKMNDIAIHYINKTEKEGQPRAKLIWINDDGSLSDDFGPGFFDEAINWKFELLRLKNQQKN